MDSETSTSLIFEKLEDNYKKKCPFAHTKNISKELLKDFNFDKYNTVFLYTLSKAKDNIQLLAFDGFNSKGSNDSYDLGLFFNVMINSISKRDPLFAIKLIHEFIAGLLVCCISIENQSLKNDKNIEKYRSFAQKLKDLANQIEELLLTSNFRSLMEIFVQSKEKIIDLFNITEDDYNNTDTLKLFNDSEFKELTFLHKYLKDNNITNTYSDDELNYLINNDLRVQFPNCLQKFTNDEYIKLLREML